MDLGLATTAALTAVAAVAGCVDAIAGGGGLLTLPALLTAGVPAPLALGTNKGQSVFGSGAATLRFARAGKLTWRRSLPSFAAGFAGSLAGAAAVSQLDTAALKPLIIVLLCVAAVLVLVPRPRSARPSTRPLLTATAIALTVGAYDGFFGPGTGTLLIVGGNSEHPDAQLAEVLVARLVGLKLRLAEATVQSAIEQDQREMLRLLVAQTPAWTADGLHP